ncbi:DEAD-domain-containing protein [Sistotremastrum suecicum HHB10207 ss-3]|uniref:ATP-dependent RNA helicase n=1 Tax=Sistotremastrum suecicum HHB10207 ss-3 TaxID=1314776 RepID=A0A166EUZ3_9AGAM|nr:DEAD-domain-containing protein [Sistotremastrum suecicum HHB10207 ss-3]
MDEEVPKKEIETGAAHDPGYEALPAFPSPTQQEAPSRVLVSAQGLDQAFLSAEVIDASRTLKLESIDGIGLSPKTAERLHELGIQELFAVQTAIIPFLLRPLKEPRSHPLSSPFNPVQDICVSAPTGGGKTLAYVVPIVEILSARIVTRLRALIIVPTRDLVSQVRETIEAVSKGRGLKIGVATGQHSFTHEQNALVGDLNTPLMGGSSKVDILICTPGRLIDHLNGTPNFTLQHLRFLIIDEADRLLAESFQDWLNQVLSAIKAPSNSAPRMLSVDALPCPDSMAPYWQPPICYSDVTQTLTTSCQKLLFSATLTHDPSKLSALGLRDPKYFVVRSQERSSNHGGVLDQTFSFPSSLVQHYTIIKTEDKPLLLFHLILSQSMTNVLVFTKSASSTQRLLKLLQFLNDGWSQQRSQESAFHIMATAFSSDLSVHERKSILASFKEGKINVLVASDLVSRGIDLPHVSHVISYDVPIDMRKYVHRVGRTARAGRAGVAWTLVEKQEAHHFLEMMRESGHLQDVSKNRIEGNDLAPYSSLYEVSGSR